MLAAHGQGAAGGTGVSVSARQAVRAAGTAAARQPRPVCAGRGGRAGTAARAGAGDTGSRRPALPQLDTPRATLRVVCRRSPTSEDPSRHRLAVQFLLSRPRTGEKTRTLREIDRPGRPGGARTGTVPARRLGIHPVDRRDAPPARRRRGHAGACRMSNCCNGWRAGVTPTGWNPPAMGQPLQFHGQVVALTPHLENGEQELSFTHRIDPAGRRKSSRGGREVLQPPAAAGAGRATTFYLLRNAPPPKVLEYLAQTAVRAGAQTEPPAAAAPAQDAVQPRRGLGAACASRTRRRRSSSSNCWTRRCGCGCWRKASATRASGFGTATNGVPNDAGNTRRRANRRSWTTRGWSPRPSGCAGWTGSRPSPACGSAMRTKSFSARSPSAWAERPAEAEYLGNPASTGLFLAPRQLKPRLVVKGSGIDWLAVSAEWEQEGLKLTKADLQRLAAATGRFVKLPDSGWVELDTAAVQGAHEAMADMGVDGLVAGAAAHRAGAGRAPGRGRIAAVRRFAPGQGAARAGQGFKGVPPSNCRSVQAEMRPYQKDGFDFLCHLVPDPARRNSRGRHGPGQDLADAGLAGLAQGPEPEESQAVAGHLPGLRAAQLAARGQPFHARPEGARAGKRRGAAQPAQADSRSTT